MNIKQWTALTLLVLTQFACGGSTDNQSLLDAADDKASSTSQF